MNLGQIYEGWRNKLLPPEKLKETIEQVREERLAICNNCTFHSKFHRTLRTDDHCTKCSCPLQMKTSCLSCSCPLNKWEALVTEEQQKEMENG